MDVVPEVDLTRPDCYYLPMHWVVKEFSSTTKSHIVFDTSIVTTSCNSLNDYLIPGPFMYAAIPDLLINIPWCPPVPPHNSIGDGESLELYRDHSLSC